MLEDTKEYFDIKRREYKSLNKEVKALKQALDELKATYERLEEAHEKLGKANKKFEKAYSSLLNEQNKKKHVETCCQVHKPRVPHGPASQQKLSLVDDIANDAQLLGQPKNLMIG